MIAIIDYGMGNLHSVQKAFEAVSAKAVITHDPQKIQKAASVVLPGVGAMEPAMQRLTKLGMIPVIKKIVSAGKPFLGICLGFQLLFDSSSEGGEVKGLGLLKGNVERFSSSVKIPHMGWNQLEIKKKECALLKGIDNLANVYFCHSYFVKPEQPQVTATLTTYDEAFTSTACRDNIFGVQFHPEKSQKIGLKILKNFTEI